jgi:hypothetical protein
MTVPMHLRRFVRMAVCTIAGFGGVFLPTYMVGFTVWLRIRGVLSHSSGPLYLLGAFAVLYISMWPAFVLTAIVYSPLITLLSYRISGRWLLLASAIAAFIVPALIVLFRVDLSLLGYWPAAVLSTVLFGGFCGQILRTRVVATS